MQWLHELNGLLNKPYMVQEPDDHAPHRSTSLDRIGQDQESVIGEEES